MVFPLSPLGRSDLRISRIGFGAAQLGGHAWGKVDQLETSRAVRLAIDEGINMFDTADCYGLGRSEELLGIALAGVREQAFIATKFGVRFRNDKTVFYDNHPDWIDQSLEASLRRLDTDHIDLFQVHYWDGATPQDLLFGHLELKRDQGKIGYYGVTNMRVENPGRWPGLVSFSFEFSLAERKIEEEISRSIEDGLTFIGYGSLAQGLLSGKYKDLSNFEKDDRRLRESSRNFHGNQLPKNLKIVEEVKKASKHYPGATVSQVALAWLLRRFDRSSALVGIKTRRQLSEIVGVRDFTLSDEDFYRLEKISSLDKPVLEETCSSSV